VKSLEGISFKECEVLPSIFQNGSKEFQNLRLLDLTKTSPNMVGKFHPKSRLEQPSMVMSPRMHDPKVAK
jgi:hypothetical protein